MDTKTGNIIPSPLLYEFKRLAEENPDSELARRLEDFKEMEIEPTPRQLRKLKIGRNNPCPCGSGDKFKKCCLISRRKDGE